MKEVPWQLPEHRITSESRWLSRRQVVAGLGLGAVGLVAGGCPEHSDQPQASVPADVLARFPAARDPAFDPGRPLTPEELASRHNNFYELTSRKDRVWKLADRYRHRPWALSVEGLVDKPRLWDVDELMRSFPLQERHYRFRCVEAWSATLPWTGIPLRAVLEAAQPSSTGRFVRFVSLHDTVQLPGQANQPWYPWPYQEGLTLPEAMHPLSFLATGIYGKPLPGQHGAPVRLVTPWKYGFKQAKALVVIEVTAERPQTFWNSLQPQEYDFWGNVDPAVPHPRWSQAEERLIDDGRTLQTQLFNGYGEQVAALYRPGARYGFG